MTDNAVAIDSAKRSLAIGQLLATGVDAIVIVGVVIIGSLLEPRVEIRQTFATATFGYSLGIASVSGVWMSLGPLSRSSRILVAPLICLSVYLLEMLAIVLSGASAEAMAVAAVILPLTMAVQFLLVQAPYWLTRSWCNWQVVHKSKTTAAIGVGNLQFSLLQVMLAVTMATIALGVGRWAMNLSVAAREQRDGGLLMIADFGLLVACNALAAWPLAWALLSPSASRWRVTSAIALTSLWLLAAYSVLHRTSPGLSDLSFWILFAPQPAILLTHLLATRLCGYLLVSQHRS